MGAKADRPVAVARPTIGDLYVRHAEAAVRLAYLLTGDGAVAEDLVQDAFVKLAGRLVHMRDPQAFDAYLRTTIVNLSHSHFRRKRVERTYLRRARLEAVSTVAPPSSSIEDREELWRALSQLSSRQRAAIVLRFYEDLSEAEVGDILSCAPGTVKSLVSRGLEKLRSEVRREDR
jgi:RNA polymerase sigma-70 factor (sigma-E family)